MNGGAAASPRYPDIADFPLSLSLSLSLSLGVFSR